MVFFVFVFKNSFLKFHKTFNTVKVVNFKQFKPVSSKTIVITVN